MIKSTPNAAHRRGHRLALPERAQARAEGVSRRPPVPIGEASQCYRVLALVLAALILAPLGARAADLVVWWEKGFYAQEDEAVSGDRRRLRAEDRQAGRARPTHSRTRCSIKPRRRSRPGSRPTFCSASAQRTLGSRDGPTRTGSSTSRASSARSSDLFDADAIEVSTLAQRQDRAGAASTRCRWAGFPTTSMSGTASWSGPASRSPTSRRSGRRSGPSGATRCSRRCARPWAATTSGVSGCPCRPRLATTPRTSSSSSSSPTRRPGSTATAGSQVDDPAVRRRHGQGAGRLHRDLAQGLHAARLGRAGPTSTTTRRSSRRPS